MKRLLVGSVAMVAFGAMTALANYGWGPYLAYWKPADTDGGFGPGMKITIEMVPSVQLELRGAYFNGLETTKVDGNVDLKVIPLEAGLALNIPVVAKGKVLAGGGGGYFLAEGSQGYKFDNEFGGYATLGFEYEVITNASLFVEAQYNFVKMNYDVSMNGPGANLGLMVTW